MVGVGPSDFNCLSYLTLLCSLSTRFTPPAPAEGFHRSPTPQCLVFSDSFLLSACVPPHPALTTSLPLSTLTCPSANSLSLFLMRRFPDSLTAMVIKFHRPRLVPQGSPAACIPLGSFLPPQLCLWISRELSSVWGLALSWSVRRMDPVGERTRVWRGGGALPAS